MRLRSFIHFLLLGYLSCVGGDFLVLRKILCGVNLVGYRLECGSLAIDVKPSVVLDSFFTLPKGAVRVGSSLYAEYIAGEYRTPYEGGVVYVDNWIDALSLIPLDYINICLPDKKGMLDALPYASLSGKLNVDLNDEFYYVDGIDCVATATPIILSDRFQVKYQITFESLYSMARYLYKKFNGTRIVCSSTVAFESAIPLNISNNYNEAIKSLLSLLSYGLRSTKNTIQSNVQYAKMIIDDLAIQESKGKFYLEFRKTYLDVDISRFTLIDIFIFARKLGYTTLADAVKYLKSAVSFNKKSPVWVEYALLMKQGKLPGGYHITLDCSLDVLITLMNTKEYNNWRNNWLANVLGGKQE